MKDRQIALTSAEPRIFVVSASLHCICMTGLVFVRSSFGFGFLRPKGIFFAFTWAFALYSVYAWIETSAWKEHRAMILFGGTAAVLYWIHLGVAFFREWTDCGEHEQYSGIDHLVWLRQQIGQTPGTAFENNCRLWIEPALALFFSALSNLLLHENGLSRWLLILSVCLWSKEAFNRWFSIRQRKRQKDIFVDTEDSVDPQGTAVTNFEPPRATRKMKVKRSRNTGDGN